MTASSEPAGGGCDLGGGEDRYRKITVVPEAVDSLFVELFLDAFEEPPESIVLDLDATDAPLHGSQEGRFFHGYYRCYCYLPLYIFCGDHLLLARLRRSGIDASEGIVEELKRIVTQSVRPGPRSRFSSGSTQASPATRSCPGARATESTTCSAWRATPSSRPP